MFEKKEPIYTGKIYNIANIGNIPIRELIKLDYLINRAFKDGSKPSLMEHDYLYVVKDISNRKIVGVLGCEKTGKNTIHAGVLAVHPKYRRKGVAKALISALKTLTPEGINISFNFDAKEHLIDLYKNSGAEVKKRAFRGYSGSGVIRHPK